MKKLILLALCFMLMLTACSNYRVEIKDPEIFYMINISSGDEDDFRELSEEEQKESVKLMQKESWEEVPEDWQGMGGLTEPVTVFANGSGQFLYFSTEPNYEKTLVQIKKENEQEIWFAPKEIAEDMEAFCKKIADKHN